MTPQNPQEQKREIDGPRRQYKSPKTAAIWATLALIIGEATLVIFPTIGIVISIVAAVMFLIWQVRCSMNLQPLGTSQQKYSPTVGVIWWFIPLANLVFPCLVIREIWRRSHPNTRPDWEPGQPDKPKSRILIPWWLIFNVSKILSFVAFTGTKDGLSDVVIISEVASLIALVLGIILIWQITSNQEEKHRAQSGGTQIQPGESSWQPATE